MTKKLSILARFLTIPLVAVVILLVLGELPGTAQIPAAQPPPPVPVQTPIILGTPAPMGTAWPHVDTRDVPPFEAPPKPVPEGERPVRIILMSDGVFDARWPWLIERANSIVLGTVVKKLEPRWDTVDGKRPIDLKYPGTNFIDRTDWIYTPVVVSVEGYLKSPQPEKEVILRVLGGRVGEDEIILQDEQSRLVEGDWVLLYLPPSRGALAGARLWTPQTTFKITTDSKAVNGPYDPALSEVIDAISRVQGGR